MAITATHYELLRKLPVKRGSTLLEIGEANWYGDVDPLGVGLQRRESLFDIAKDFYRDWFEPSAIVSIDANGTPDARRCDLNLPVELENAFGVVINHGTAEHVFNVAQVFKTMHDACDVNGWMIHDAPFVGWFDHGFYCLQPTLFYDVALANCYEVHSVAAHESRSRLIIAINSREHAASLAREGKLPQNTSLLVALRKRVDQPFRVPTQGYYAGALTAEAEQAWRVR